MRLFAAGLLGLALCQPSTQTPEPAAPTPAAAPAVTDDASAEASAAPQADVPLALDVPLISGDAEPLASVRGTAVVMLLGATDLPGWDDFRRHYEARLDGLERGRLTVITVANDADARALQTEWDRDPPPFLLGWDPDGAMALRLGVARLPAAFVLDARGHVVGSVGALDDAALAELDGWIDDVLPPPPPAPEPEPVPEPV